MLVAFPMRNGSPVSPPKIMKSLKVTKAKMTKLKGGMQYKFTALGVTKDGVRSLPSNEVFQRTSKKNDAHKINSYTIYLHNFFKLVM